MTRRLLVFDDPDRFTAGTVGEPGSRTFFLQARKGGEIASVRLEKVQVAALAARLDDLLDAAEVARAEADVAAGSADAMPEPLAEPLVELFQVGAMALAWDAAAGSVVIEAQTPTADGAYVELPDDAPDGPDVLRVRIMAAEARKFARDAAALVDAGRPPCPFCGEPLDPQGHFCRRGNEQLN